MKQLPFISAFFLCFLLSLAHFTQAQKLSSSKDFKKVVEIDKAAPVSGFQFRFGKSTWITPHQGGLYLWDGAKLDRDLAHGMDYAPTVRFEERIMVAGHRSYDLDAAQWKQDDFLGGILNEKYQGEQYEIENGFTIPEKPLLVLQTRWIKGDNDSETYTGTLRSLLLVNTERQRIVQTWMDTNEDINWVLPHETMVYVGTNRQTMAFNMAGATQEIKAGPFSHVERMGAYFLAYGGTTVELLDEKWSSLHKWNLDGNVKNLAAAGNLGIAAVCFGDNEVQLLEMAKPWNTTKAYAAGDGLEAIGMDPTGKLYVATEGKITVYQPQR